MSRLRLFERAAGRLPTLLAEVIAAQGWSLPGSGHDYTRRLAEYRDELLACVSGAAFHDEASMDCWRIRDVMIEAQSLFTMQDCRAYHHENSLTSMLVARVAEAARWLEQRHRLRTRRPPVGIWSVELIVGGGEQRLGGDLVLVLEDGGRLFVTCLQAKRWNSSRTQANMNIAASTSRNDPRTGRKQEAFRQLSLLRKLTQTQGLNIACGYLAFDNDALSRNVLLPLVKDVHRLEADIEKTLSTDLAVNTVDFATHVSTLLMDRASAMGTDADTLRLLARTLVEDSLTNIVCVTADDAFAARFARAFGAAWVMTRLDGGSGPSGTLDDISWPEHLRPLERSDSPPDGANPPGFKG